MLRNTFRCSFLLLWLVYAWGDEKLGDASSFKERHLEYLKEYRQVGDIHVLWTRLADEYPDAKKDLNDIRISLKKRLKS